MAETLGKELANDVNLWPFLSLTFFQICVTFIVGFINRIWKDSCTQLYQILSSKGGSS